jgi:hypothetical protein
MKSPHLIKKKNQSVIKWFMILYHDRDQKQVHLNTVRNLWVLQEGAFLTSSAATGLS